MKSETASVTSPPAPLTDFALEHQTYEAHKAELLRDEGKFVVILGEDVAGVWPTYEDALQAGFERNGLRPFYVNQITATEAGRPTSEPVSEEMEDLADVAEAEWRLNDPAEVPVPYEQARL